MQAAQNMWTLGHSTTSAAEAAFNGMRVMRGGRSATLASFIRGSVGDGSTTGFYTSLAYDSMLRDVHAMEAPTSQATARRLLRLVRAVIRMYDDAIDGALRIVVVQRHAKYAGGNRTEEQILTEGWKTADLTTPALRLFVVSRHGAIGAAPRAHGRGGLAAGTADLDSDDNDLGEAGADAALGEVEKLLVAQGGLQAAEEKLLRSSRTSLQAERARAFRMHRTSSCHINLALRRCLVADDAGTLRECPHRSGMCPALALVDVVVRRAFGCQCHDARDDGNPSAEPLTGRSVPGCAYDSDTVIAPEVIRLLRGRQTFVLEQYRRFADDWSSAPRELQHAALRVFKELRHALQTRTCTMPADAEQFMAYYASLIDRDVVDAERAGGIAASPLARATDSPRAAATQTDSQFPFHADGGHASMPMANEYQSDTMCETAASSGETPLHFADLAIYMAADTAPRRAQNHELFLKDFVYPSAVRAALQPNQKLTEGAVAFALLRDRLVSSTSEAALADVHVVPPTSVSLFDAMRSGAVAPVSCYAFCAARTRLMIASAMTIMIHTR